MTGDGEEHPVQRATPRRLVINFIWYQVLGATAPVESDEPSLCGIARTCDVSASGVGLFTARPLPVDALIFLEIATGKGNLSAVGRIVYSRRVADGQFRAGIRLEVVPPNDRPALARIVGHER